MGGDGGRSRRVGVKGRAGGEGRRMERKRRRESGRKGRVKVGEWEGEGGEEEVEGRNSGKGYMKRKGAR